LIAEVDEMRPDDLAVMEISSFQLEGMQNSPQVAAVLNITPNHLDRHTTMEEYKEAKARILKFQSQEGMAVLNHTDPGSWDLRSKVKGTLLSFGLSPPAEGGGAF
jgi:UDP-N-acetylmuramoylalanine--D-glutamate ligase